MQFLRQAILKKLKEDTFDLLVIGGGATGAGIALDATARGLSVALVEKKDFASGTSSKSTKLLHGGVRYLEQAVKTGDFSLLRLVSEGLKERKILLQIAPHLTRALPIVIPVYSWARALYYGIGMKLYEALARHYSLGNTNFLSKTELEKAFPHLQMHGLKGGIQFFDGQFDDVRMNLSVIFTAIQQGAAALNYVEVVKFEKEEGNIAATLVKDILSGEEFLIKAKRFVNAAGPYSDLLRKLDDKQSMPVIAASAGTHLVLDSCDVLLEKGLLIPRTSDGRVLFALPWKGSVLFGTTDIPTPITFNPKPQESEITYLLDHLNRSFRLNINQDQIKASWTGIRPLIASNKGATADLSRDFKIMQSRSGLYSVIGGKWTSFRRMAESFIDRLFSDGGFGSMRPCLTKEIVLFGGERPPSEIEQELIKKFLVEKKTAEYLSQSYGTKALDVARFCRENHQDRQILKKYPFLVGEVSYAFKHEMACSLEDVLYRRLPLGRLDQKAAQEVLQDYKLRESAYKAR